MANRVLKTIDTEFFKITVEQLSSRLFVTTFWNKRNGDEKGRVTFGARTAEEAARRARGYYWRIVKSQIGMLPERMELHAKA